jgi:hypothetical protein
VTAVQLQAVASENNWKTLNYVCEFTPHRVDEKNLPNSPSNRSYPANFTQAQVAFWAQTGNKADGTGNAVVYKTNPNGDEYDLASKTSEQLPETQCECDRQSALECADIGWQWSQSPCTTHTSHEDAEADCLASCPRALVPAQTRMKKLKYSSNMLAMLAPEVTPNNVHDWWRHNEAARAQLDICMEDWLGWRADNWEGPRFDAKCSAHNTLEFSRVTRNATCADPICKLVFEDTILDGSFGTPMNLLLNHKEWEQLCCSSAQDGASMQERDWASTWADSAPSDATVNGRDFAPYSVDGVQKI